MFSALLSLVVISFSGVMAPGPMFAVTLAESFYSPWAGSLLALGHAVVEVPLILLIYFGFSGFLRKKAVQIGLSILGGGVIIWLGIGMYMARTEVLEASRELSGGAFTAGILMSALNPFFLLWWATVGSLLIMRFPRHNLAGMTSFILAHWLCDFIWLSFVSVLVYNTQALWGRTFQEWLFIACSLLLLGFGGWYLFSGVKLIAGTLKERHSLTKAS